MSVKLKQSTSVVITFGPFVDKTDGVTFETALAGTGANQLEHTSSGILISKNGGTLAARNATATASTYDAYGMYKVTLDATDTNTLGILRVCFGNNDALPVWQDFEIVTANVWDSRYGTDILDVSLTQILGTAVSTPATAGILDVNLKNIANATVSTSSAQLGVNVVNAAGTAWGSGAITAASIASDAITAAKIATGAIDADALATDAVTEIWAGSTFPSAATIADSVWDEDATAHQTVGTFGQAIGDPGADTDSIWGLANTNLDATISSRASQSSVNTLAGYVDTEVAAIKAVTDLLPNGGALTTIQADLDDIQTRLPAALVSGRMDASVGAMATDTLTAAALAADAVTEIWAGSTAPNAATIADAVWDEDATGHQTQGTFGQAIGDPGADADTIWALANANLDATVSSRASQASVDTIDSIVDAILIDTAEIGAAGAGLTNINLPNQTMDIVGNITGNLSGSVGSVATGGIVAASFAAGAIDAAALAADAGTELADALLKRDMSAITGEAARSPLNALRFLRNKWSISGTTLTVTEEDDTTTAWTATLTTNAAADPITATDPA